MKEDLCRVKVRVGDWREGDYHYRIVVEARLSVVPGKRESVEHETITDPVELGISADVRERRHGSSYWREHSSGQCVDSLRDVTEFASGPGAGVGWDAERRDSLVRIWERWHLNGMRAACAHMPTDAHTHWNAGEHVECSAGSGYRYGTAWLCEELPADVHEELRRLFGDKFTA